MKRFLFFALSLFLSSGLIAQNDVTFAVDMNDYTGPSFTTVYISGAFNGWSGDANPMDDTDGDGVWTAVLSLADGDQEFKYTLDNWSNQEFFAGGENCTLTTGNYTNRFFTVAGAPVDLGTVCWQSCDACTGTSTGGDVTFSVDMTEYIGIPPIQVYVSGTFNGWAGDANPMDDSDGDGIWTVTLPLDAGDYEYKFTFDNWLGQENLTPGSSCTITTGNYTNRLISVSGDLDIGTVCWDSCDPCGMTGDMVSVTFNVNMNQFNVTEGVYIAGGSGFGFPGDNPMDDSDGDGIYTATFMVPEGFSSHFTFINGDCGWGCKENIEGQDCADPGNFNDRFLNPVTQDTVLNTCFQECVDGLDCTPVVQNMVTFSVDMNEYTGTILTGVFLSGSFNGWSGNANPMDDSDGDGVWETTIEMVDGDYTYKFQVDEWYDQENFFGGESCTVTSGNYVDRFVSVSGDATLPTVCWASCDPCGVVGDMVSVTFNVNMSEFTVEPGGVFIGGGSGFGGPTDNMMDDSDGDGVYSITFMVPEGFSSHYTFLNGDCGWGCKENIEGQSCADPGNFNDRFLSPVTQDTVLNTCFQECVDGLDCAPVNQNMVTFSVDMNDYADAFTTVFLSGSFNAWAGNTNPMDDSDGDGVWEVTLELVDGDYEYKFQTDEWNDQEMFVGGEDCTITTGNYINRIVTVAGSEVLPTVCWESCAACGDVGVYSPYGNDVFRLAPSITSGAPVNLFFDEPSTENRIVRITNTIGQVVHETTVGAYETVYSIESAELTNGMYLVLVEVGKQTAVQKFIVSK